MEKVYRFAEHDFQIKPVFNAFFKFAEGYEVENGDSTLRIENSLDEIQKWKDEHTDENYPLGYIETLVTHSKIANELAKDNVFIFHGSTIYVDDLNNGFIFTAPSGTGKSTHINILRKVYQDRVNYVNDDKPFVSFKYDNFYVYGSPWNGKSRLSNNVKAKLNAIFIINRSATNFVKQLSAPEAMIYLHRQIYLPKGQENTKAGSDLLISIVKKLPIYLLNVNMEDDAALTSMKIMESIIGKGV